MVTIRLSRTPAWKVHPTPQYAHVVRTWRVAGPCSSTVFSDRAPVGHSLTQAPQETQLESAIRLCPPAPIAPPHPGLTANPLRIMETARAGCISSQARTHLAHEMHL